MIDHHLKTQTIQIYQLQKGNPLIEYQKLMISCLTCQVLDQHHQPNHQQGKNQMESYVLLGMLNLFNQQDQC